jgi:hypothetical protein
MSAEAWPLTTHVLNAGRYVSCGARAGRRSWDIQDDVRTVLHCLWLKFRGIPGPPSRSYPQTTLNHPNSGNPPSKEIRDPPGSPAR